MKRRTLIFGVISLLCCSGGAFAAAETPQEALRAIMQLYQARDFDALIRTRYAEISKAPHERAIQALVDQFTDLFQDDTQLQEAINTYQTALLRDPVLTDNGMTATFYLDDGFIRLSRMSSGKWGFHL